MDEKTEKLMKAFYGMIQENTDHVLNSTKSLKKDELKKVFIKEVISKLLDELV